MAFTINGFGTRYYGNADSGPDGSFVSTEWITVFYLPVAPIRSFRMLRTGQDTRAVIYNSTGILRTRVPIHWKQVRNVYLATLAIIGGLMLIPTLIYFWMKP